MRIRTRSLILIFSQGVAQLTTLVLTIVLVRLVSQETLGAYRQALLAYTTLATLLSLDLGATFFYFIPRSERDHRREIVAQTVTTSLVLSSAMALVMFLLAAPIARVLGNEEITPLLRLLALLPFGDRLTRLLPSFLISVDRAVRAGVYSILTSVVRIVAVVITFSLGGDLAEVFSVVVATTTALGVIGLAEMLRLADGRARLDRQLFREQIAYVLPLWLTAAVGTLNVQYDKILISASFDPATYAIYVCGAIELPIVQLVTVSITSAILPNMVTLASRERMRELIGVWQEAARKASLVIFPSFALFMAISADLIALLYGPNYVRAAGPFAVYLLMLPLRVGVYAAVFRATGQTRPVAVGAVVTLVVNVVVSTTLVWIGGDSELAFIGPSIGTVVATCVAVVYLLWCMRGVTGLRLSELLRWRELTGTLGLCCLCGVVAFLTPVGELELISRLVVRCAVFGVALTVLVFVTGALKQDEIELLRKPFSVLSGRRSRP